MEGSWVDSGILAQCLGLHGHIFVEGCFVWMADNEEFLKQAEVAFFLSGLNMIGPFLAFNETK